MSVKILSLIKRTNQSIFNSFKKKMATGSINLSYKMFMKNSLNPLKVDKSMSNWKNSEVCSQKVKICSQKANFCSESAFSSGSDSDMESEDIFDEAGENSLVPLREVLNPNKNDFLISELNNCSSVQEIFDIIRTHDEKMDWTHLSQAVIVLWDLQKCFYKHNFYYQECNVDKLTKSHDLLKNYITKVKTHSDFQKLLMLIEQNVENFSMDALTCCLIYLNRMGVNLKTDLMQKIILRVEKTICESEVSFPLTALSRFTVAIFEENDSLWSILTLKNALPIILRHLENCDSVQNLKLITICFNKMYKILTPEILEKYKIVLNNFIDKLTYSDQRTILKCVVFLSRPQWLTENTNLVKKLFHILKKRIHILTDRELIMLFKVFQKHKEPADMLDEIQESASNRLSELDFEQNLELSLDLLSCIVSFSSPLQRPKYEGLVRKYLGSNLTSNSLTSMYKILYHIRTNDSNLCNIFWNKILGLVRKEEKSDKRVADLLNLCHKYISFNQDGKNFYRNYKFERTMTESLLYEIEFGISGLVTNRFSRISSFIIAFNHKLHILEPIFNRIKNFENQLTIVDCLNISKSLQISSQITNTQNLPNLNQNYNQISQILTNSLEKNLKNPLTLPEINLLLKSYNYRNFDITSQSFLTLLNYFNVNPKPIPPIFLKDLAFVLNYNCILHEDLIENLVASCLDSGKTLLGTSVDKLLVLCYFLGYFPQKYEEFCDLCSQLIIRDKERFSGLAFIQSALALCFYNKLPEYLVKHIFSVDFLEKLDEELSHCYAKTTYPMRVRNHIMQLNRAVCLDYVECDVPWFHQKYVEQTQNKAPTRTHFHQKVYSTILDVVKDQSIISEHVFTPYGYQLDFEINLSKEGHPVPRKLAINILPSRAYTNLKKNLKGYYQLKKRHLEILGYEVIFENQNDWKELYTQEQCYRYLSDKILPSNKNFIDSVT